MISEAWSLQRADSNHLWQLQSLFRSAAEVTQWGGEGFSYPLQRQQFLQQLLLTDTAAFVLLYNSNLVAFGQICDRFNKIHLARLLVMPAFRRRGLARLLVAGLLQQGLNLWPQRDASLYVFKSNTIALRSYQRMGFQSGPHPAPERDDLYFMTLPNQACQMFSNAARRHSNDGE